MALVPGKRDQQDDQFVGDASFGGTQVKRGFSGGGPGVVKNTPFSSGSSNNASSNTPFTSGGSSGVRIDRGSGFGRSGTGGRVRSRQPRRPSASSAPDRRPIASPERQRVAGENLVSAPNRNELRGGEFERDTGGDANALLQSPIAGLDANAVTQQGANFKSVTDPSTGLTVPNLADKGTKDAFNRFFDTSLEHGIRTGGSQIPGQKDRNADPTRAAFQNRFFKSETLSDLGIGKRRSFPV